MTEVDGGGVPAGTQLNGIYEIEKRIAMGGMGEVYTGKLVQTGDKVAIKMILPEHANNELILDLFRKEASTLHNLYHEAIVRYYVFSVDPVLNRPYLAMEYAEGPALSDRVRTYPLSEAEMSVLLPRIAGGLNAAHRAGIVHRDLSPDNIILVGGDVEKAKIIDFGIAKSSSSEGTLIGSGFAGKLKYVSPEQLGMGGGEVTGQSDIYSLGLVLAEAATGHPLDMGGSQVEVIDKRRGVPDLSNVPGYIRPLINWMIQPDPKDRPATMEVVANWTPSTPMPTMGAAPAGGDATMIAPAGFAGGATAPPSSPQREMPQQQAPEEPKKRRRRGPLPVLSILFSGTAVAGVLAAVVLMSDPDLKLVDGKGAGSGETTEGNGGSLTPPDGNGGTDGNTGTALTGGDGTTTTGTDGTGDTGGTTTAGTDGTGDTGGTTTAGTGATDGTTTAGNGDGTTTSAGGALLSPKDGTDTGGTTTAGDTGGENDGGDGTTTENTDGTVGESTPTGTTDEGDPKTAAAGGDEPTTGTTPGGLLFPLNDGGGDGGTGLNVDGGDTGVETGGPDRLAVGGTGGDGAVTRPETGAAPRISGGDTPTLTTPGAGDGGTPTISGGDAPTTPGTGTPTLLDGGGETGPSLTTTPVDRTDKDPATDLVEPNITKDGPGVLTPGGDTELAGTPTTGGTLTPGGRPAPTTPGGLDTSAAGGDGGTGLTPVPDGGTTAPRIGGGDTPTLTAPGAGDGTTAPRVAGVGDGQAPDLTGPKTPELTGGGGISGPSLTKTPVAAGEKDPAADLAEPTVAKNTPGGLSAPTAPGGDGTPVAGGDGDNLVLPRTGSNAPTPTTPSTPGGGTTELAAIAAPKDQPPTIRSRAPDALSAGQGKPLDIQLGEFFDEDDAINLELRIQGDVPNGLTIEMVRGGIAKMHGIPTEYGEYTIKVAAVDSAGLLSESITVALSVERPLENRDLRDYILAYQGGACFLSRPMELSPGKALIEVFASKDTIPAVYQFDKDFKTQNGFEAQIRARLISNEQCELVRVLDQVGPRALDNSLVIKLIRDQLVAGDALAGKIQGGRGARLFLFDRVANVADLSGFVTEAGGEIGFSVPISGGTGPQILIAARPRDGSGLAPDASLNQLLAAAQQGKASLALGFFILK